LAEVRQLRLPDIKQRRRGVLTAIYHHIGKNLKAGRLKLLRRTDRPEVQPQGHIR
jgi:hypothetical protein